MATVSLKNTQSLLNMSEKEKYTFFSSNKRDSRCCIRTFFQGLLLCEENTFIVHILLNIWKFFKQHFKGILNVIYYDRAGGA